LHFAPIDRNLKRVLDIGTGMNQQNSCIRCTANAFVEVNHLVGEQSPCGKLITLWENNHFVGSQSHCRTQ
jgi:hypothetical protein